MTTVWAECTMIRRRLQRKSGRFYLERPLCSTVRQLSVQGEMVLVFLRNGGKWFLGYKDQRRFRAIGCSDRPIISISRSMRSIAACAFAATEVSGYSDHAP